MAQGPPLPSRQIMSQWWRDISFLHWRVDPDLLAPQLPAGVRPDLYDGSGWVGLIPFRMVGAGVGHGPAVPWLGTFLETNVRYYTTDDAGRRGVVFASLEAERLAVVGGANASFGVPYQWAKMSCDPPAMPADPTGLRMAYASRRRSLTRPHSHLEVEVGEPVEDPQGLELFLTARFGLHTRRFGRSWWIPNTHGPWPLRHARALRVDDQLVSAAGLPGVTDRAPDSVLFSSGVQTVFGLPQRL